MKAITQDRYGPADVLALRDVARPSPRDGEVLIRVRAAGVDPGVWHLMTGLPYLVRLGIGLRRPRNPVRGMDVAGHVEAVGRGVTGFRPGDAVYGACDGTFAEYTCGPAGKLAVMPANLSFEQAAVVPVSGCTALQAVRKAQVRAGQRVLVLGASGGVGTYTVQLAKHHGAHVTGVCSGAKADLVRSLGADEVLDYARDDVTGHIGRYDVIVDCAGLRSLAALRRALTPAGTLVVVGGEGGGRWLGGVQRSLFAQLTTPFVKQRLIGLISLVRAAELVTLRELIEAGHVKPVVGRTYPLAEAADAVRDLAAGHARGKLAVTVA